MSVPQFHNSVEVKVFKKSATSYIVKLCNMTSKIVVLCLHTVLLLSLLCRGAEPRIR